MGPSSRVPSPPAVFGARRVPALVVACALAASALAVVACEPEPAKSALGYTEGAKHAFDQAMEQFNAHDWIEAQTLFHEVKRKYSYSKYARMAELRIADADYEQDKFSDAIREYKDFIHAHRSDEEDVAYARARIGQAMFAEIPDSLFMAASEERDQASVVDAYKELKSFLADYPSAKETPHVRELLAQVVARLIRHELYVARFYLGKNNYDAAVARITYALHNYPLGTAPGMGTTAVAEDARLHAEALLLLGETYLKMHKWPEARQAFETIVQLHALTPVAIPAKNYLASMSQRGV